MIEGLKFDDTPNYDKMIQILQDSLTLIKEDHVRKWLQMTTKLDEELKKGSVHPKTRGKQLDMYSH